MDAKRNLHDQHAKLRRSFDEMEKLLGPEHGVGWDDCANCDMAAFRRALEGFLKDLRRHEAEETRVLGRMLDASFPDRRMMKKTYAESHAALDRMVQLLSTAAAIDHGGHVYSVRSIAARVRQELEEHFAYEEREILPLLTLERSAPQAR